MQTHPQTIEHAQQRIQFLITHLTQAMRNLVDSESTSRLIQKPTSDPISFWPAQTTMNLMFLSLRDIAFARGRFALMTGVVGMITLLLVMLSGLTGGLGKQNTSALEDLDPAGVVFTSEEPSFTESAVTNEDLQRHEGATALGVGQTRMETSGTAAGVGLFGLPEGTEIPGTSSTIEDTLTIPESIAEDLALKAGDTVQLAGQDQHIGAIVPDAYYSHSPVVWTSTQTWADVTHAPADVRGTVLLTSADAPGAVSLKDSFNGLASYSSEQGSLLTMQAFLYVISALVTVAFLSVWTIQRTRDLSILRALGASARYLLKDALGQAAVVLTIGAGLGGLIGWGLGALAAGVLPFELSATTVLLPTIGIWILGMLGAMLATRQVSNTDPLLALGGNA